MRAFGASRGQLRGAHLAEFAAIGLIAGATASSAPLRSTSDSARAYVQQNLGRFGLSASDVSEMAVSSEVASRHNGVAHVYFQQRYQGIDVYNAILNDPASSQADLSSVRLCISAAEPLAPEVWRRWKDAFGLEILDGIGSTELLHIFCSNSPGTIQPGSSGKPVPGYDLDLRSDHGSPVGPGEVGNLFVRGDSASPWYWHQHAKSQRTMQGEWIHTGDRYRRDADGFYWYEGRSDDMIKVRGEWVSPIEIEHALGEHPAVHEAAVVGIPQLCEKVSPLGRV